MSFNDPNHINLSNMGNDEFKYYYENDSGNVTYEDIDTFAHSRGREIHENNSNNFNNDLLTNLLNPRTNLTNRLSVSNNNNLPNSNDPNRHTVHLSHSYIAQINNPLDSSNLNVGFNLNSSTLHQQPNSGESQIDDIFDQFTYAISTEKQNLRNDKANLNKEKKKFLEMKAVEIQKLHKEREDWKERIRINYETNTKETDILDLDIGGTQKITTTRGTLTKYPDSALGELFSGRHQLRIHNGRHYLDRDGNVFIHVVNFLSNSNVRIGSSKLPVFKSRIEENAFLEELEFWKIDYKQDFEPNLSFDPDWVANTLILDNNRTTVKKQSKYEIKVDAHHGIVFLKTLMDVNHNFVEFKVIMNIPSRGKNHLFVGLVDKSKYKYDHLMSTFWKDSPSSYYWDVWNSKIIRTDENGIQISSIGGYGCPCEEYETKISILYDYKTRSLSFEKNGVNQGIAFKNVPPGMTPSLDIWFESGTVEIIQNSKKAEKVFL